MSEIAVKTRGVFWYIAWALNLVVAIPFICLLGFFSFSAGVILPGDGMGNMGYGVMFFLGQLLTYFLVFIEIVILWLLYRKPTQIIRIDTSGGSKQATLHDG